MKYILLILTLTAGLASAQNISSLIIRGKVTDQNDEPRAPYLDWNAYYGYGWMIDQSQFSVSKKHQVVYHLGTDNGFNSMFLKQPDKGITLILLNNTGAFPIFDITDLILDELDR